MAGKVSLLPLAGLNTVHKRKGARRDLQLAVRGETASQAIGSLYPGCEIFGFTKGQFCIINVLEHVLNEVGPADVVICTVSGS